MKLDPKQASEIMAIHYLPGLRLAYEELGKLISQLSPEAIVATAKDAGIVKEVKQTEFKCSKCGATGNAHGKPFDSKMAVNRHMFTVHTKGGKQAIANMLKERKTK